MPAYRSSSPTRREREEGPVSGETAGPLRLGEVSGGAEPLPNGAAGAGILVRRPRQVDDAMRRRHHELSPGSRANSAPMPTGVPIPSAPWAAARCLAWGPGFALGRPAASMNGVERYHSSVTDSPPLPRTRTSRGRLRGPAFVLEAACTGPRPDPVPGQADTDRQARRPDGRPGTRLRRGPMSQRVEVTEAPVGEPLGRPARR